MSDHPASLGEASLGERELAHLSATFISLPAAALDAHVEQAIGRIAGALGLDRAIVAQESPAGAGRLRVTHQWAGPGLARLDAGDLLDLAPREEAPWIAERIARSDPVLVARPGDLPPEASRDEALMRRLGARSAAIFPLAVAGRLLGWMALLAVRGEHAWPPRVVESLRLATEVVASALERRRAALALDRALEFERLVGELCATFVRVPAESLDKHIVDALGRIGAFLGADRGNVFQHVPGERAVVRTHQWTRDGVPGPPASEPDGEFPWLMAQVLGAQVIVAVTDLDDLPAAAARDRAAIARLGVRSGAMAPMVVDGKVVGVLGFGSVQQEQHWSAELSGRLGLVAEVIAHALARRQAEAALRTALADNERLREQLAAENVYFQEEARDARRFGDIVGESAAIAATLARVDQVAATDVPVLLLGETGTGKELLARAVHERSRRRERPLIAVNCAALPAPLIESELFGYERGAFTGAVHPKAGRFELADGGTLFLDEIGDLDPALQATLLRVLQEGEIQRLGAIATRKVDVRVVAATNRDLRQAMREGRFRDDLWYRLSVFPIEVPPLRERPGDIPLLVWHFIRARQRALGRAIRTVPEAGMAMLAAYRWPGNVRELQNVIDRALILSPGPELRVEEALGHPAQDGAEGARPGDDLRETERQHIERVLRECGWRVEGHGQAAERLGLRPSTLRNRMRRLGIHRPPRP